MRGVRLRPWLEGAALVAAVAFVVMVTYLPHADTFNSRPTTQSGPQLFALGETYHQLLNGDRIGYRYPIHVDENVHWEAMANTERAESLRHEGLFFAFPPGSTPLQLRGLVHEQGFHTAFVEFQVLTGIPWESVFQFAPALWMGFTALLIWLALRPWAAAPLAAALVGLAPTTVRFLGPGFLVPSGFGLAFVAATLVLIPRATRSGRAAVMLLLVVAWAFFIHLVIGFACLIVLLSAMPFARRSLRELALLAGVAVVPLLVLTQAFASDIGAEASRLDDIPIDFTVFDSIGVPFLFLWVAGCALVALYPPRHARMPILAATLSSGVVLFFIIANIVGDLRAYALYDRWHAVYALLGSVPVAYAMALSCGAAVRSPSLVVRRFRAKRGIAKKPSTAVPKAAAALLGVAAFAAVVDMPIAYHMGQPYYHVLEDRDWVAYRWAAENVNASYDVFLSEPWKSVVFAAMSGKEPYTYLAPGSPPVRGAEYQAYRASGFSDGVWLVQRDISFVIDPVQPTAPEFLPTGPMTSQLDWGYASSLHRLHEAGSPAR